MFKIQTINAISPIGLSQFIPELYKISSTIEQPDAILVRSQILNIDSIPHSVKVIGRAGAGVNNIPVEALTKKGIPVLNTPGANANAVCELVIAGMLLASRHLFEAQNYVQQLNLSGDELDKEIEKNKKKFSGFELRGKVLGVIGLGSIGVKVANAAIGLGMDVIGHDPTISVTRAWELSSNVQEARSLDDLLAKADFISLHVPLMPSTKQMINHARLQFIKKNAVLLNFSREGIVDEDALVAAMNEEQIYSYVTDFPTARLKNLPRTISFPHLGASTQEAEENCAVMIVNAIRDFLETGSISNSVNFPTVHLTKLQEGSRLTIVNANIPNMVAQISAKLADAGLNIVSLVNQSQNEIAYTVIDVQSEISDVLCQQIRQINGVIQLRKLG